MCVAAPMKIVSIDWKNHTAVAELEGNKLMVSIRLIDPKIGDYVLVHAGCALEILSKQTAEEIKELFDELKAVENDSY